MSRHFLLRFSTPAILLGLVLFAVCLAGVWSVSRLQANLARILSEHVTSLEAAQELEIQLRHLRLHALLWAFDPTPARLALIQGDHEEFEAALEQARSSAHLDEEVRLVEEIRVGYSRYRDELEQGTTRGKAWTREDFLSWADAHPVRHLAAPCHELLRLNKDAMAETARESEALTGRVRFGMVMLGLAGPIAGLIAGLGIARGFARSVARLEVRVQDLRAQLDNEVATVRLPSGGNLDRLEQQLDDVVTRVHGVVEQVYRQQQDALRAEQLSAVGQLAASVAHEVRNPLTSIKMLVGVSLRGSTGLTAEDLRVIYGEVVRMEQTVQNLLDFARPPDLRPGPTDLRECVNDARGLVRGRAEQQGVHLSASLPDSPVTALVDGGQMRAVLVNLFLNALDALPRGGAVTVTLEAGPNDTVRLTVRDDGPGIPPEIEARLFTPFASSKPTGTGLGLSVCRRVMRQHGGEITGRNCPDGGAEFILTLPALPRTEAADADAPGR